MLGILVASCFLDSSFDNRDVEGLGMFECIHFAPARYRKMLHSFRWGESDPRAFLKYCQNTITVTEYIQLYPSDLENPKEPQVNKDRGYRLHLFRFRKTTKNKVYRGLINDMGRDVCAGLMGLMIDSTWLPKSGGVDFMKGTNIGYGFWSRACAGCYFCLLIDRKDREHPIRGITYTVR